MDHACAFRHAGDAVCDVWAGREGELAREELREGVGGADCSGSREPVVVGGAQRRIGGRDLVDDFANGKSGERSVSHQWTAIERTYRCPMTPVLMTIVRLPFSSLL